MVQTAEGGKFETGKGSAEAFRAYVLDSLKRIQENCDPSSNTACLYAEFCAATEKVGLDVITTSAGVRSVEESIRSKRAAFDEAGAKRRLKLSEEFSKAQESGTLTSREKDRYLDELKKPLLIGAQKEGSPCYFAGECASGLVCNLLSCPGVCQAPAKVGQPCLSEKVLDDEEEGESDFLGLSGSTGEILECETGAYCETKSDTCKPRIPLGGKCSIYDECIEGSFCGAGDVCVLLKKAGESCQPLTDDCEEGLSCRGGACKAPGAKGESCSSFSDCGKDLVCRFGACSDPGREGEKCNPKSSLMDRCEDTLFCSSEGVCRSKLPAGSPCAQFNQCKGFCEGISDDFSSTSSKTTPQGTCIDELPGVGQACSKSGQCDFCSECDSKAKMCIAETGQVGSPCKTGADCDEKEGDVRCDTSKGVCDLKPLPGESCTSDLGCSSGAYCNASGKCTMPDVFRKEPCSSSSFDDQCVGGDCKDRICAAGPCRPPEIPLTAGGS